MNFKNKLGYFVLDNATNNNIYIKIIFIKVWLDLIKKKQWFWYIGHIINLEV